MDTYFMLEDPRRHELAAREAYVERPLESGLRLRGTSTGGMCRRPATSGSWTRDRPRAAAGAEASTLFQMKFYALVIGRLRGRVPRLLQLMYRAEREALRYSRDESGLLAHRAQGGRAPREATDPGDGRRLAAQAG